MAIDLLASMRTYVAVVDGASFAAAAGKMNVSRAMVSKQVQKLEEHLGTRLMNRTTRRLSVTETGRAFYERSVQILGDVDEAEQVAGAMTRMPQGLLRISIPLSYGQHPLAAIIGDYTQAYPLVQLDIALSDRKVDLVEEGFDLAIRIGTHPQTDLIARKLGAGHSVACAAPAYLARHGTPLQPTDLQGHACLSYTLSGTGTGWRMQKIDGTGDMAVLPVAGPIRADNGDIIRLAALAGAGVVFQPWFIVGDDIASGKLVHLLPEWHSPELGVYAVYPSRKHLSAKVRTFVDFLAVALAA